MYKNNPVWQEYNETTDPVWRKETLAEFAQNTDVPAEEVQIRQKLFDARFSEPQGKSYADAYIGFMLEMMTPRAPWETASHVAKALLSAAERLGFADAASAGEEGKAALYWEWHNAAARYLATCKNDSYGRKLFGLVKLSDDEKAMRMEKDIRDMSAGVIEKYHLDQEEPLAGYMKIYARALNDAWMEATRHA